MEGVANQEFPGLQPTYELPNPLIGYEPAFGAAFSVQPASADGSTQTDQGRVAGSGEGQLRHHRPRRRIVASDGRLQLALLQRPPVPAGVNMAYGVGDFIVNRIRFP